jgi:lipopolysaccharide/colanic/teichoic acid biosynthesis glycosyltransferase
MTGLWQVSGRTELTHEESVELDVAYVDNWSLALDMRIVLKTPGAVLGRRGAS